MIERHYYYTSLNEEGTTVYWSNKQGWVSDMENATAFSYREMKEYGVPLDAKKIIRWVHTIGD